jgi:hypothetical protein
MKDFVFITACSQPRLRDPTRALDIIARYWFDWDLAVGIESEASGQQRLTIEGEGWPGAWKIPEHIPDEFEPDFARDGSLDFETLLEDLAPCLAEPLIVQAIGSRGGRFPLLAAEWRIEPVSQILERRALSAPDADFHGTGAATLETCAL